MSLQFEEIPRETLHGRKFEYVILNWEAYKEILFSIKQIKILSYDVEQFYETVPVFAREKEKPQIDSETKLKIYLMKSLKKR